MILGIVTGDNKTYAVDSETCCVVARTGGGEPPILFGESPTWRITGLYRREKFGRFTPIALAHVTQMVVNHKMDTTADMQFKNGSPRYGVMDVDHGTPRMWSTNRNQAVRYITVLAADYDAYVAAFNKYKRMM